MSQHSGTTFIIRHIYFIIHDMEMHSLAFQYHLKSRDAIRLLHILRFSSCFERFSKVLPNC
jgi:hypothetical protein